MSALDSDERRKDFRGTVNACVSVDLPLALSYEAIESSDAQLAQWQWDELAVSPDLVRAMVDEKDLTIKDPLTLQMLTRIDWLLTSVLKTLGKDPRLKNLVPQFMNVNLSGSGIRFLSDTEFPAESFLVLRLILRPFIPIQAIGRVLRTTPVVNGDETQFDLAVEFTEISPDDREAIIRHILRSQVTLQRQRQNQHHGAVLG
ncbi:MAG: PilZ domain-containing protein [Nitrospirales bacterium]